MTDLATAKHLLDRRKTRYNTGLAKVAVQCSAGTFVGRNRRLGIGASFRIYEYSLTSPNSV